MLPVLLVSDGEILAIKVVEVLCIVEFVVEAAVEIIQPIPVSLILLTSWRLSCNLKIVVSYWSFPMQNTYYGMRSVFIFKTRACSRYSVIWVNENKNVLTDK